MTCAVLLMPTAARATLSWSGPTVVGAEGNDGLTMLLAVACPSTDECVGVNDIGDAVTYDPSAPGPPSTNAIDPGASLDAISCPTTTRCTALDDLGNALTFDPQSADPPSVISLGPPSHVDGGFITCPTTNECVTDPGLLVFDPEGEQAGPPLYTPYIPDEIDAVACASATQCTAVSGSGDGDVYTFDPQVPSPPTEVSVGDVALDAVACPTASQCTALDWDEEVTFDPVGVPDPVSSPIVTGADAAEVGPLSDVTCASTTACVASTYSAEQDAAVTFDPTSADPSPVVLPVAGYPSVACPAADACTLLISTGQVSTLDPNTGATADPFSVGGDAGFTALSCGSLSSCTGIDTLAREESFTPGVSGSASSLRIGIPYGFGASITCPASSECLATEPPDSVTFDPADPAAAQASQSLDLGYDASCPSTTQCTTTNGDEETTFDPLGDGIETYAPLTTQESGDVNYTDVACPTLTQCTAFDGSREVTFDPQAPVISQPVTVNPSVRIYTGMSCPTVDQCTAAGEGQELTFDPQDPSDTVVGTIDPDYSDNDSYPMGEITAISCPAYGYCVGVDQLGDEVEGDPWEPSSFMLVRIAGANWLTAVSCPSAVECVAVDDQGDAFLGLAPGASPPASGTPPASGNPPAVGGSSGPVGTAAPEPSTALTGGGTTSQSPASSSGSGTPTSTPSSTAPATSTPAATAPTTSLTSRMRAALRAALASSGSSARVAALLRPGHHVISFDAPAKGRLTLRWFVRAGRSRNTLIASGSVNCVVGRTARLTIDLTSRSGRALTASRRLTLIETASFAAVSAGTATVSRSHTLR